MTVQNNDKNKQHLNWIYAISQGDRSAFEKLYTQCSGQMLAVAIQLLNRKDLAEEVLQETFVKVWYNANNYHAERGSVLTWLISIVRNRCIDEIRHKQVERKSENKVPIPSDINLNLENFTSISHNSQLTTCVEQLESSQRQTIQLAYFKGLTHREIMQHLEAPLGSIKSWIRRGLESLKRCLNHEL